MKLIKAIGFVLQFGIVGFALAIIYLNTVENRSPGGANLQPASLTAPAAGSYAEAVRSSAPSVVTIYTERVDNDARHPLLDDPTFGKIFGDQLPLQQPEPVINLGSGVIVSEQGYILTNQHVIAGAEKILVGLEDGRGGEARLIGEDRDSDIAVLQLSLPNLQPIPIASASLPEVGDVVLAIGNPLNVGQTVTMGIISATGRDRVGLNTFENFIQTDAAINLGNSGGALVNARGQLIGINSAIFNRNEGAEGISFAIPLSLALDIMDQIIRNGRVIRGWIGVEGVEFRQPVDAGNPALQGALVIGVVINGPADKAGIRPGDIITAIDGQSITGIREVLNQVTDFKPGKEVELALVRNNAQYAVTLNVTERP